MIDETRSFSVEARKIVDSFTADALHRRVELRIGEQERALESECRAGIGKIQREAVTGSYPDQLNGATFDFQPENGGKRAGGRALVGGRDHDVIDLDRDIRRSLRPQAS